MSKLYDFFKNKNHTKCSFVVVAAGESERFGQDKMFYELYGKPVILRTLEVLQNSEFVKDIVVVAKQDMLEKMADLVSSNKLSKVKKIISGGNTRAESSLAGVCAVGKKADLIAIHDGARPFIDDKLIKNCIFEAKVHKAAVPGIKITDTLKLAENGVVSGDVDRDEAVRIQTPQVFNADLIKGALTYAVSKNIPITDDSSALECLGVKSSVVEGDPDNIKITTPRDIDLANMILSRRRAKECV